MILLAILAGLVLGVMLGEAVTMKMHEKELERIKFDVLQHLNYNQEVNK